MVLPSVYVNVVLLEAVTLGQPSRKEYKSYKSQYGDMTYKS